jgi:excisionase family DNA binding protein
VHHNKVLRWSVAPATVRNVRHGELLSSRQVADIYKVSVATIARWARNGSLPSVRTPSKRLRFRRADVEAALAEGGFDDSTGGEAA